MKTKTKKVNKNNVVKGNFALMDEPTSYIISAHIRNMINTYGADYVLNVIENLFLKGRQNSHRSALNE